MRVAQAHPQLFSPLKTAFLFHLVAMCFLFFYNLYRCQYEAQFHCHWGALFAVKPNSCPKPKTIR